MDEKYIITIYEKVNLTDNIIVYKKKKIIKDATIDFLDEFQVATYYDEDNRRICIEMLENPYTIVSDDKYCYDFATKISDLKILYPDCNDEKESETFFRISGCGDNVALRLIVCSGAWLHPNLRICPGRDLFRDI